jgi:hypothetical protein
MAASRSARRSATSFNLQSSLWAHQDRRRVVDRAGGSFDGRPPGRSQAWDQCRLCGGLCLQGVPGAPAGQDAAGPLTSSIYMILVRAWER